MKPVLSRRELAAALAAPALTAQAPPPASPSQELDNERKSNERTYAQLRKFQIAATLEPSFAFKP